MQRVTRYIFNSLTVLSLLLCIAVIASTIAAERRMAQFRSSLKGYGINEYGMVHESHSFVIIFGHRVRPSTAIGLTAFLPTCWILLRIWRLLLSRWQPEFGVCRFCGYDLCATPDRCPECGAVPTRVKP